MTLLEDLNSGKYNLILFLILFVLVFYQHWQYLSKTTEHMADVSLDTNIKEAIKQVYNADVEAIRNLSEVATKLQAGGLTIPGNLTVTGNVLVGSKNGNDGQIELINKKGGRGMLLASNIYEQGGSIYLYSPTNPEGQYNFKNHIHYDSSTLVPKGTVVAWAGTTAPDGWVLCDGVNGTPDLRGRFVLGLGKVDNTDNNYTGFGSKSYERSYQFNINETGGENKHILDINEMPTHTHPYADSYFSEAWGNDTSHGTGLPGSGDSDNDNRLYTMYDRVTSNTGGSQSHNNMPPYYVLAYIMKL